MRMLVLACLEYNIVFRCHHVPGFQNVAVHLSRFQIEEAKKGSRLARTRPDPSTGVNEARSVLKLERNLIKSSLASYYFMFKNYLLLSSPGAKTIHLSHKHLAGFIAYMYTTHYTASTIISAVSAITHGHKIVG